MTAPVPGPIVVGYDNSPAAQAAMRWAAIHARQVGAELVVVYVTSSVAQWELAVAQIDSDPIARQMKQLLEGEWTSSLRAAGVPHRTQTSIGRTAVELTKVARAENASLIVIGMTSRGTLSELAHESTQHLLRSFALRPIVAVPEGWSPAES